ncbi:MAG: Holliday junction resolvase Hjc [Candidatus Micrarchaeia archaeon]
MKRYSKGARAERELLNYFASIGYSVMRSAGSGVNSISPDILVIKNGHGILFESKAWDSTSISIDHEKFNTLKTWSENTKMDVFMAWRMNGQGWFFIKLDEMTKTEKNYTVTKATTLKINRRLENIIIP